jgi:hypothetical protein
VLCGAVLAGPWGEPGTLTDMFAEDRSCYRESSAAIDVSAGVLCALAGYAALDDTSADNCGNVRTALSGRSEDL